jgi:hypothetical protein
MHGLDEAALRAWEGFYVIVGTSAGALTGLQFVVLTLITEAGRIRGTAQTLSAFASPNVVHFCVALLSSAIMTTPWPSPEPLGMVVALMGAGGFLYAIAVLRRALRQSDYRPVLEDWIWHGALPIVAYAGLVLAGALLVRGLSGALFLVAGATLLLVFIGIHNAWDTVLYVMIERTRQRGGATAAAGAPPANAGRAHHPRTRSEILAALASNADAVTAFFSRQPPEVLFTGDPDHWGPAHHLFHLTRTSRAITGGMRSGALPPHPTGHSRSYRELIEAASTAIAAAPKEFTLERGRKVVIAPGSTRAALVEEFAAASADLRAATESWKEEDLDRLAMPHPFVGTMTAREMLLFCVFHERHHLKLVRSRLEAGRSES